MNYHQIAKDCPKAWREFNEPQKWKIDTTGKLWRRPSELKPYLTSQIAYLNYRDLYDYFDELGIHVEATLIRPIKMEWGFIIWFNQVTKAREATAIKSRKQAEYDAFTQAFNIRETQL